MAKVDDVNGVWRTVGGRRIFIKDGQDLASAMKESGKFKLSKKQKEAGERLNKNAENGIREDFKQVLSGKQIYDGEPKELAKELSNEWGIDLKRTEEILNEETKKYLYENNMPEGAKFSKMLEENNVRTFADEIKEKADRIKISNQQETNRHIKNATSQKSLKAMAEAGYAKDITRNSFEANEELREKHGRLERIKTIKGAYGINGAILRSRETGEYFVITARNSNIDYWI